MAARAQVAGIGGVFFKARDPVALAAWYREHLGVPVAPDGTHALFAADPARGDAAGTPAVTVWSTFPADTAYFGAGPASWMINYRVPDLDAMLAQLRAGGGVGGRRGAGERVRAIRVGGRPGGDPVRALAAAHGRAASRLGRRWGLNCLVRPRERHVRRLPRGP
jgi:hypothetical protein